MNTFVVDAEEVTVPSKVADLQSFRQWIRSADLPKLARVSFLAGDVRVDMSKEQLFTHNQVKGAFAITLGQLVEQEDLGRYVHDGILLTNVEADLSCGPDGLFFSHEAVESDRVRLVEGVEGGCVEIEGSPEMTLEVISASSVHKDASVLRELYHRAGIDEYWLVDARGDETVFQILRRTSRGYTARRQKGGWIRSEVFGRNFQVVRRDDRMGNPRFSVKWQ